ncbi:MAG: hypothetical protein H6721_13535 [Sandaracinus sp.]|nr:hypothetical protein [Sandaracinus sp.]MCB9633137.1 hypothetical protein [Sandaracinus sp.]
MTHQKDETIRALLARLELGRRGWHVVDHWDADLQAIGIATERDRRHLVYVSTFSRAPGRFDYECKTPSGPDETDRVATAAGEDVDYETLVKALEAHLG